MDPHEFTESPGWRNNPNKTVGVTWDGQCVKCGFTLLDRPFASGIALEGGGRRLERCVESFTTPGGKVFRSEQHYIYCSECVPAISHDKP